MFNDLFSVVERVPSSLGMQGTQPFAHDCRKYINSGGRPLRELENCKSANESVSKNTLSYLDKGGTCSSHLLDKETIPPYCTPSITFEALLWFSEEEHRTTNYNGDKKEQEMYEALCSENGFPYSIVKKKEDSARNGAVYF